MARRLTSYSWLELKAEMSIAGDPEKMAELGRKLMNEISQTVNYRNPAELTNIELVLKRINAEIRLMRKMYNDRTGQETKH